MADNVPFEDKEFYFADGKPATPKDFIKQGFTIGMKHPGQGMLRVKKDAITIFEATFFATDKENFLEGMSTMLADKIFPLSASSPIPPGRPDETDARPAQ